MSPLNGTASPRENGIDKLQPKKEHIGPHRYDDDDDVCVLSPDLPIRTFCFCFFSPRSGTSSNASTPSTKKLEDKPSTPISKSITPTSGGSGCSGAAGSSMKPMVKGPSLGTGGGGFLLLIYAARGTTGHRRRRRGVCVNRKNVLRSIPVAISRRLFYRRFLNAKQSPR